MILLRLIFSRPSISLFLIIFITLWNKDSLAFEKKGRLKTDETLMCQELSVFDRLYQQNNAKSRQVNRQNLIGQLNTQGSIPPPPFCIFGFKGQEVGERTNSWTIFVSNKNIEEKVTFYRVKVGPYWYWIDADSFEE